MKAWTRDELLSPPVQTRVSDSDLRLGYPRKVWFSSQQSLIDVCFSRTGVYRMCDGLQICKLCLLKCTLRSHPPTNIVHGPPSVSYMLRLCNNRHLRIGDSAFIIYMSTRCYSHSVFRRVRGKNEGPYFCHLVV